MANDTMPFRSAGDAQLHALAAENAKLRQATRGLMEAWEAWSGTECWGRVEQDNFLAAIDRLRELIQ